MPRPQGSLSTDQARQMASKRRHYGAGTGRPRSAAPRCACGAMTAKRANARGHKC